MSLFETIQIDWKTAFKAKDMLKKDILSFILAQAKNKKIELGRDLSDDEMIKLIKKEIKGRRETIAFAQKNGNTEEVDKETSKVGYLEEYLPEMLSEGALAKILTSTIESLGIQDLAKQRGVVIGAIMKEYGAQVDGGLLNQIIQKHLAG